MRTRSSTSHRRGMQGWGATSVRRQRRPPTRTLRVAAYTSPGLVELGERIGFPLAIIDAVYDPSAHSLRLRRDEHACWTLSEDWLFDGKGGDETDPLSPDFRQLPFDPRWLGGRRPPAGLALDRGSILVTLPANIGIASFRALLGEALAHRRFESVAARPGRIHRQRVNGRSTHVQARYSRPGRDMCTTSFERVDDLYEFRPDQFLDLVTRTVVARDRAVALRTVVDLVGFPTRA